MADFRPRDRSLQLEGLFGVRDSVLIPLNSVKRARDWRMGGAGMAQW